jgi:tetratricopeptide (TPR) repeat protein
MLLLSLFLMVSDAKMPQETFAAGVRAHLEGNYAEAQSAWEKLAQTGLRSADIEYNLGTSYAESGDLGSAMLHLRRAALLRSNADISANLQLVREKFLQQNPGKKAESSLLSDLATSLVRAPLELMLGVSLLFASALAFWRFGPRPARSQTVMALFVGAAALALVSGALAGIRRLWLDGKPAAVVMKRTPAKNGADERFKTLAELVPGEELWLLPNQESTLGYAAVQLAGGETAYVDAGSVSKVKDW